MPPKKSPRKRSRTEIEDEEVVSLTTDAATKKSSSSSSQAVVTIEDVNENEGIFHDVDLSEFWLECKYSTTQYIEPSPTAKTIQTVEKKLGYKLPQAYIELCQKYQNGGMVKKSKMNNCHITGIFAIGQTKPNSLCGNMGSAFWIKTWQYPKIGVYFADCPSGGHDMLCLDYSLCGPRGEPQIAHIDQEVDFRKTIIAKNFTEFIKGLEVSD